jgi:phosphatidylethanolamine N-methyltransferase
LPSTSRSTTSSMASTPSIPSAITSRLASEGQEEQQPGHEDLLSTSAATEGDTFTETELETETTETEMDDQIQPQTKIQHTTFLSGRHPSTQMAQIPSLSKLNSRSRYQPQPSITSISSDGVGISSHPRKRRGMSQHDLLNRYFRRDAVVLRNIDLLRYVYFSFFINSPVDLLFT